MNKLADYEAYLGLLRHPTLALSEEEIEIQEIAKLDGNPDDLTLETSTCPDVSDLALLKDRPQFRTAWVTPEGFKRHFDSVFHRRVVGKFVEWAKQGGPARLDIPESLWEQFSIRMRSELAQAENGEIYWVAQWKSSFGPDTVNATFIQRKSVTDADSNVGYILIQEEKDPDAAHYRQRSLSLQDDQGNLRTAVLSPSSSTEQVMAYVSLLTDAIVESKIMPLCHLSLVDSEDSARKLLSNKSDQQEIGFEDNTLSEGSTHGAYYLRLSSDFAGYSGSDFFGSSGLSWNEALQGYQSALKVPVFYGHRSVFPYFKNKNGRTLDSYNFLLAAIDHTDPSSWGKESYDCTIADFGCSSFDEIMQGPIRAFKDGEFKSADHGYFHLLDLVLRYVRKKGDDPQWVKEVFVEKYLRSSEQYDHESYDSHLIESLGILLSVPGIRWSEQDRLLILAWIKRAQDCLLADRTLVFSEDENIEFNFELAHMLRGMRLIQKYGKEHGVL